MVGCSVPGCSSRSEKGFFLKQLPTDPIRRAMWIEKLPQRDWSLQYLRICEIHFAADQFEKLRVDGKKKLKACALPTLFYMKNKNKTKKKKIKDNLITKEQIQEAQNNDILEMIPHLADECLNKSAISHAEQNATYLLNENFAQNSQENKLSISIQNNLCIDNVASSYTGGSEIIHLKNMDIKNNTNLSKTAIVNLLLETTFGNDPLSCSDNDTRSQKQNNEFPDVNKLIMENESYKLKNKKLEEDIVQILLIRKANEERFQARIEELEKKLVIADKYLRKVHQTQLKEINKIKERKQLISKGLNVNHIFNEDQLKYLGKRETSRFFWSNETLNTAVQLKLILGHKKFKDLLSRNYPLPSVRTVSRRLERFKVAHFQKDVVRFLKDNHYSIPVNDFVSEDMDIDLDCGAIQHNEIVFSSNLPEDDNRIPTISDFNDISSSQILMTTPMSEEPAVVNRLPVLSFHFVQEDNLNISNCKISDNPKQSINLNLENFGNTLTN